MLVSAAEQKRYMSEMNFNASQTEEVTSTLSAVQAELENYCHRPLELVQVRELVRTDSNGYANLSVTPVWKILLMEPVEIAVLPEPLNLFSPYIPAPMARDDVLTNNELLVDMLFAPTPVGDPLVVPGGLYIGALGYHYVIEYIGGFNLKTRWEFEGVKQDIKRVAARELTRQHDDTLSLRGDQASAASDPDPRIKGWTAEELAKWDRLRRRVIA